MNWIGLESMSAMKARQAAFEALLEEERMQRAMTPPMSWRLLVADTDGSTCLMPASDHAFIHRKRSTEGGQRISIFKYFRMVLKFAAQLWMTTNPCLQWYWTLPSEPIKASSASNPILTP